MCRIFLFMLVYVLSISGCSHVSNTVNSLPSSSIGQEEQSKLSSTPQALVTAANPLAVKAGTEILKKGGSAIDAAIAVQATLGLVEPQSSGLAGGAFLLYYSAKDKTLTLFDGREKAPRKASSKMFLDKKGNPKEFLEAVYTGHSIGAPGVVAMLSLAHQKYGLLPWSQDFQSTIKLAQNGFPVSPRLHKTLNKYLVPENIGKSDAIREYLLTRDGQALPVGYLLKNPAYVKSLKEIAKNPRSFYEGKIAEEIVKNVSLEPIPGRLSLEDLKNYRPKTRQAICRPYRHYKVCSAPPPASGGVLLNELLGVLETIDMSAHGPDTVEGWHFFIEAARLAYADRDAYVADPDYVYVPVSGLLEKTYLRNRAKQIHVEHRIPHVTSGQPENSKPAIDHTKELGGTSHFVIIDSEGNIVSMTTSVEYIFGSKRMAGGMILNNQLTDFSFKPIDKNGRAIPNAVAPEKRPRSSMSPTLIFDEDGKFLMAIGSPGGNSIPSYVAKTIVGVLDWGLSLKDAINLPNVVARGDQVKVETQRMDKNLVQGLKTLGHVVIPMKGENSGLHGAYVTKTGKWVGAADPRREGKVGYVK